ncbi:hypothetical protein Cgig2_007111 [Carnegiea gigantea]|uniref:Uncharacterized protein n=1 Tax=Carnegiea gigantea TaxID=171969 RepID=A0A9Q1JY50_9CARY|nr:hypothetical protein Cgig2_007111 [Carnegiea gigantea]
MGVLDVLRLVEEVMGEGLRGRLIWHSLKCNRMELLPLGRDADVGKLMKGRRGGESVGVVDGGARAEAGGVGSEQVPRSATEDNTEEVDKQKTELRKWKNGVGGRIEMKLRKTLANIGCVAHFKLFNTALVIHKHKLWVYDYVSHCYNGATQGTIYMNSIHPMEMHDLATVDNATGLVVSGEALDDGSNRRILLPNPRPQGKPRQRRIESQTQGVQMRRCSKCRDKNLVSGPVHVAG